MRPNITSSLPSKNSIRQKVDTIGCAMGSQKKCFRALKVQRATSPGCRASGDSIFRQLPSVDLFIFHLMANKRQGEREHPTTPKGQ
eukprot:Skav217146  [mRNA]  locus=scaffold1539:408845:409402:+ [translate_table: standard]